MRDVQKENAKIPMAIDKVGIRGIAVPLLVRMTSDFITIADQLVHSEVSLYTDLNAETKGTHMSRLAQVCLKAVQADRTDFRVVRDALAALRLVLGATDAYIKFRFSVLRRRKAPATHHVGYVRLDCELEGELVNGVCRYFARIEFPYMSLCPCSKAISAGGAHNQRSIASIRVEVSSDWIEHGESCSLGQLILVLEAVVSKSASTDVYPVMKREDEKESVDRAYEHPAFVEDVARSIVDQIDQLKLEDPERTEYNLHMVDRYVVVVTHMESIHQHDAIAVIRKGLV